MIRSVTAAAIAAALLLPASALAQTKVTGAHVNNAPPKVLEIGTIVLPTKAAAPAAPKKPAPVLTTGIPPKEPGSKSTLLTPGAPPPTLAPKPQAAPTLPTGPITPPAVAAGPKPSTLKIIAPAPKSKP